MEHTKQEDIKEYVISMANKISKTYIIINLILVFFATLLLILINTVLKDSIDTVDIEGFTKILAILLGAGLFIAILVSIALKAKAKASLNKLPSDINEKFKTGVRFKDMQRFIFADEGLITFIDARAFYIKYIDMQRVYVFKLSQKVFFIPVFTQYFINIETLERKYSISIKKKMDKIKYTEQDFIDLTYELHSKNENITLGGILKRSSVTRVNV